MITSLGTLDIPTGLRALARTGYSARNSDGFTNHIALQDLQTLIDFLRDKGFVPAEPQAQNFWGRCHVRPHRDGVDCPQQVLWAITWTDNTDFYSGNTSVTPTPGSVWLFNSVSDLHGVYTYNSALWSCFVMDVKSKRIRNRK